MYIYIYNICIYSIHVLISCCHFNGTSKSALGTLPNFAEEVAEHDAIWPKSRKKGDKMVAARHLRRGAWDGWVEAMEKSPKMTCWRMTTEN